MSSEKSTFKKCVVNEPRRPRRNPNRNGYQVDAAGEKRTAGRNEGNITKNASEILRRHRKYICCLDSKGNCKFKLKNFKQRICVSKFNIYFGMVLCQANLDWSHNF